MAMNMTNWFKAMNMTNWFMEMNMTNWFMDEEHPEIFKPPFYNFVDEDGQRYEIPDFLGMDFPSPDFSEYSHKPNTHLGYDFTNDTVSIHFFGHTALGLQVIHVSMAMLGLIGLMGNILNIIVWTRPQLKSFSAILLTSLAFIDLLTIFCTNVIDFWLYVILLNYHTSPSVKYFLDNSYMPMVPWNYLLYHTANTTAIFLTVVITFERYFAMCHPFQYQGKFTCNRAYKLAVGVIIFSFTYNFIRLWVTNIQAVNDLNGNFMFYAVQSSDLANSFFFDPFYTCWLQLLFMYFLPLATLVFLSISTHREMKKSARDTLFLTDTQRSEVRLTRMISYTVVEFLVCSCVSTATLVLGTIGISTYELGVITPAWLLPLHLFLNTLNSSLNFVTYITFGGRFRTTFVSIFSCRSTAQSLKIRNVNGSQQKQRDLKLSNGIAVV